MFMHTPDGLMRVVAIPTGKPAYIIVIRLKERFLPPQRYK